MHIKLSIMRDCFFDQIVDARPKGRFDGTAPEPNPKIHSGHILGSVSLPFMQMTNPGTKTMKDKEGILLGMVSFCCVVVHIEVTLADARTAVGVALSQDSPHFVK